MTLLNLCMLLFRSYDLQLWVFTPDLKFSSSVESDNRDDPTRAMKIFWQATSKGDEILQERSSSFEEIILLPELFQKLSMVLDANANMIPSSARRFQEWNVSLLARFPGDDQQEARNPIDPLYE